MTIAVIGGGVAGICASLAAEERGADVSLFEKEPFLGGRAAGGERWDTGRHLVTTAYSSFLQLLDRLGSRHLISFSPMQYSFFSGREIKTWQMNMNLLGSNAPVFSLLTGSFLPLADRLKAVLTLKRLVESAGESADDSALLGNGIKRFRITETPTVSDAFREAGWPDSLIKRFGYPVVRSMFNCDAGKVAYAPFAEAVRRLFEDKERKAGWITGNVGRLITQPALQTVKRLEIDLHLGKRVKELRRESNRWEIRVDSQPMYFDRVILTVPPGALTKMEGDEHFSRIIKHAREIQSYNIVTFRYSGENIPYFSGPIADPAPGDPIWFFNPSIGGGGILEEVFSGLDKAGNDFPYPDRDRFLTDLKNRFGIEAERKDVEVRPYAHATPALFPGTPRPVVLQGDGLYYAGDWAATGLPPTLESAAHSGWLAGEAAAEDKSSSV